MLKMEIKSNTTCFAEKARTILETNGFLFNKDENAFFLNIDCVEVRIAPREKTIFARIFGSENDIKKFYERTRIVIDENNKFNYYSSNRVETIRMLKIYIEKINNNL